MFKDLIEYVDLQEACAEMFGFSDVTFKRDFGHWKKGDKVYGLWFNLETSLVQAFDEENEVTGECQFKLEAC